MNGFAIRTATLMFGVSLAFGAPGLAIAQPNARRLPRRPVRLRLARPAPPAMVRPAPVVRPARCADGSGRRHGRAGAAPMARPAPMVRPAPIARPMARRTCCTPRRTSRAPTWRALRHVLRPPYRRGWRGPTYHSKCHARVPQPIAKPAATAQPAADATRQAAQERRQQLQQHCAAATSAGRISTSSATTQSPGARNGKDAPALNSRPHSNRAAGQHRPPSRAGAPSATSAAATSGQSQSRERKTAASRQARTRTRGTQPAERGAPAGPPASRCSAAARVWAARNSVNCSGCRARRSSASVCRRASSVGTTQQTRHGPTQRAERRAQSHYPQQAQAGRFAAPCGSWQRERERQTTAPCAGRCGSRRARRGSAVPIRAMCRRSAPSTGRTPTPTCSTTRSGPGL